MDIIRPEIQEYAEEHSSEESTLLSRLNRETHVNHLFPRMLSGRVQGRFLAMLSRMINPRMILEVGTYTGYSALCLAEGLQEGGLLYSIELNDENEELIKKYIREAGFEEKIVLRFGHALDILPDFDEVFDLVFLDADKENYISYYKMALERLSRHGIILADNTLWSGKVLDPQERDKETRGIKEFNEYIKKDDRVDKVMLTIRDGMTLIMKK